MLMNKNFFTVICCFLLLSAITLSSITLSSCAMRRVNDFSGEKAGLEIINKDEKSFKYWSRSLIYDYQVLECQSYEEYENKVKNGIICESDRGTRDRDEILWYKRMDLYFYYTYSPADEEYRNDMKTVLSNGAEIRSGMTKNEVKAILSEAGAVSRLPDTLGTGMLAYELIGKDEGFLLMMKFADKKLNWMIKSAKLVEDTDTAEVKELSDFFKSKPFEFTDDDYNRMLDFDRYVLYINSSSEELSFVEYDEKVKAGEIIAPVLENEAETLEQIKTLLSEKGSILS